MRLLILRLTWPLVSFTSTSIAIPIGYAIALGVTTVVSLVPFFLWIFGAWIGLLIGSGLGGMTIGWIIGQAQQWMLGEHQPPHQRLRTTTMSIWAIAGWFCLNALLPIISGDVAPLVPTLLITALIGSGAQWIVLLLHKVPGCIWWGSGGMLGAASGAVVGLLLLGALHGRVPTEVLAGLNTTYESISAVHVTRLVELNGKLVMFVAIEKTNTTNRWELWTSDGTAQGTTRIETGYTGWNEANVSRLTIKNDLLFFEAHGTENQADSQSYLNGLKAWVTDGTPAGSHPWSNSMPLGSAPPASQFGVETPQLSNGVATYFVIQKSERSIELWRRDAVSGQEILLTAVP